MTSDTLDTSTEVARKLLPTAGAWTQTHVACALEELTEGWIRHQGHAAPIDSTAVQEEVWQMNMARESRDDILAQLKPLTFECRWILPTFERNGAGFELRTACLGTDKPHIILRTTA